MGPACSGKCLDILQPNDDGYLYSCSGVQVTKLQQQVRTLERENVMLRQVIRNMQGMGDKAEDA